MIKVLMFSLAMSTLALAGCTDSGGSGGDGDVSPEQNSTGGLGTTGTGTTTGSTTGTTGTGTTTTGSTTGTTGTGTTTTGSTTGTTGSGTTTGSTGSTTGPIDDGSETLASNISNGATLSNLSNYWSCRIPLTNGDPDITYSVAYADDSTGTYSDSNNEGVSVSWSVSNAVVSFLLGGSSTVYAHHNVRFNTTGDEFTSDFYVDGSNTATHICNRTAFNNDSNELTSSQFVNGSQEAWSCTAGTFRMAFVLVGNGTGAYVDSVIEDAVEINTWSVSGSDMTMNLANNSTGVLQQNRFSTVNAFNADNYLIEGVDIGATNCLRVDAQGNPVGTSGRLAKDPTLQQMLNYLNQ
ncbi:MAG: hypothetical protein KTR35_04980 [Gammaproteobacteria bacterium]|nr:hypothetical protein [Gammaproteobacteria bacterium]